MINKGKSYVLKYDEILEKLRHYCAYRERCIQEVVLKLSEMGVKNELSVKVIDQLIKENFIDEKRFAKIFARGKFRINKWGRIRISAELLKRNIAEDFIKEAVNEIDNDDYYESLKQLISKKEKSLKTRNNFERKQKLAAYAISKGYESDLVWKVIKEMF